MICNYFLAIYLYGNKFFAVITIIIIINIATEIFKICKILKRILKIQGWNGKILYKKIN